jgi:trigger factor
MEMLIQQAARQYREEDRDRFVQFIRSNALAAAQLRAPLYEDKVVDFLFDKAEVSEREVTKDELQAAIEAEESAPAPKPAKGKKAPAKKTAVEQSEDSGVAKPAAKKARAKKAEPTAKAEAVKKSAPAAKAPAKKAAAKPKAAKAG